MRVYPISNDNSNFKSLKIADVNSWNGKTMQEFVKNIEVQKFVKYWHDKGIDIIASGHGDCGVSLMEDSTKPNRFFYGIYPFNGGIKNFNASEAIAKIAQATKEKFESQQLIQDAQDFVTKFNRALNINSAWEKAENKKNDKDFYKAFVDELLNITHK